MTKFIEPHRPSLLCPADSVIDIVIIDLLLTLARQLGPHKTDCRLTAPAYTSVSADAAITGPSLTLARRLRLHNVFNTIPIVLCAWVTVEYHYYQPIPLPLEHRNYDVFGEGLAVWLQHTVRPSARISTSEASPEKSKVLTVNTFWL